jgi:acyl carrier protein
VNDVETTIRDFLLGDLDWPGDPDTLGSDTPLLEGDALDSVGIYELVTFLEERYGIEIHDEDVVPEHFGTIGSVAALVAARR